MDLKLAVKARLPLIGVSTRDSVNCPDALKSILGYPPIYHALEHGAVKIGSQEKSTPLHFAEDKTYFSVFRKNTHGERSKVDFRELYAQLVGCGSTLIVVNPPEHHDALFQAGELPVPEALVFEAVNGVLKNEERSRSVVRALGGCTIKEAVEVSLITMARDGSLTPGGAIETRKSIFQPSNGLTQIYTDQTFYEPPKELLAYAKFERAAFSDPNCDPRLVPRGILADGPPGTGKSSGAKWLASYWGLPLFRIDMSTTKNKYIGESERNNSINLERLDTMAPCIAIMDEVEKTYGNVMDHETSASMFSQTLWWLNEHRSRVFVYMTTNNKGAIPPEMYRPGRVDQTMWFGGLSLKDARTFVIDLLATFKGLAYTPSEAEIQAIITHCPKLPGEPVTISHSQLTQSVYKYVKKLVNSK